MVGGPILDYCYMFRCSFILKLIGDARVSLKIDMIPLLTSRYLFLLSYYEYNLFHIRWVW